MPEPEPVKPQEESQTKAAAPQRKFPVKIIPILLLIIIVVTAAWYFAWRKPAAPSNLIRVSGRIEAVDSTIAAKVAGKIREISVREGDLVKAGQVIAVLEDEQAKAREEQATAAVRQAESRIQRARGQIAVLEEQVNQSDLSVEQSRADAQGRVTQAENQVSAAEAQLAQAEANQQQAQWEAEKFARLFKTGDTSERIMRQAETAARAQGDVVRAQRKQVESARGALTTARANLTNPRIRASQTAAIREQIKQAQSDIDAANADAERARAQLREVTANRGDLTIIAPFDGTVATRVAEPGEVVSPGTPLLTLVALETVYLRAFVPEGDIGRVKIGQPARIYLDSNPGQAVEAEVSRIDPEATFTPENTYFQNDRVKQVVGVKLAIKNPQGFAKPGMPADGEILVSGEWTTTK